MYGLRSSSLSKKGSSFKFKPRPIDIVRCGTEVISHVEICRTVMFVLIQVAQTSYTEQQWQSIKPNWRLNQATSDASQLNQSTIGESRKGNSTDCNGYHPIGSQFNIFTVIFQKHGFVRSVVVVAIDWRIPSYSALLKLVLINLHFRQKSQN